MNEGDVVIAHPCRSDCGCVLCSTDGENRVGLITHSWIDENDLTSIIVHYETGEWTYWSAFTDKVEVISSL